MDLNIDGSDFAFPNGGCNVLESGMTMRDWFAGMALQGCLAHAGTPETGNYHDNCPDIAKYCYSLADKMIAERKKS